MYLKAGVGWIDLDYYSKQVMYEEFLFRYLPLSFCFLHNWPGIIATTIIWSLLHLIGFRWPMAAATMPLGILLGWLFVHWPHPLGLGACIVIHLIVGVVGYKLGIIEKWIKKTPYYYIDRIDNDKEAV